MDGAEDGNEMILERPDGTFGGVSTVFFRGELAGIGSYILGRRL
jgi:hypothetical protein